jgi:aryl-phospho-beta-D-glucosidase BglC (GH1 family)
MIANMRQLLILLGLFAFSLHAFSQGFLRTQGSEIVNDKGAVLLRGIGLGGWVLQEPYMLQLSGIVRTQQQIRNKIADLVGEESTETFYRSWIKNGITKEDIDSLASWGFNSIRFPMHYRLFTLPIEKEPIIGENTWLEENFTLTDSLLSWCKINRMYLMLDLHAAPGGQGNDVAISDASETRLWENEENKKKTIALWRKIAEHYADEEWIGGYDILNEPNYGFESREDKNGCAEKLNQPLQKLLIEITKAIREVDTRHIIVISGNCWGNNYNGIFPLWDNNIVISFHKYWNYNNEGEIRFALDLREQNNAPLWLSESGENSNAWFTDAVRLIEKNNIGWCWWTYKKMGNSCPMEIKPVEDYSLLKQYWKGNGDKPNRETVLRILNQLAENYKIKNTVFHKDYIDALFRQVKTEETLPFKAHRLNVGEPLVIFAVDYDMGHSGKAYHDKDSANYRTSTQISVPWNSGNHYRNDGVDIVECFDDLSNGYCVSDMEKGEWLQYTIDVEDVGNYIFAIRTTRAAETGQLHVTVNGENRGGIVVPIGSTQEWIELRLGNTILKPGKNTLRLYIDKGGFRLNYIRFTTEELTFVSILPDKQSHDWPPPE